MKNSFKRITSCLLVATMLLPLGDFGHSGMTYAADGPGVKVNVTDSSSSVRSILSNDSFKSTTNTNPRLQGEAFAEISYSGTDARKLEYQFVRAGVNSASALPTKDWMEIPLNGSTENPDVMIDYPGNLKRRSYDVTMLPNINDTSTWNDRSKVYKYPFEAREIISAAVNTKLSTYGTYINYLDYQNANKRRFAASTVFSALDGNGDMYPPDDYFYWNGTPYKINFNGEVPYITISNDVYYLKREGAKYYFEKDEQEWYQDRWGRWKTRTETVKVYSDSNSPSAKYQESSKMWGYIKVPTSGTYYFGMYSDDGATGTITVDGASSKFYNKFQVQGTTFDTGENKAYVLSKDKYYPISLEYFNWGGGAQFRMVYKSPGNSSWTNMNPEWFYPSQSDAPGEYANTTFTGATGVKLPTESGDYYILYKATGSTGSTVVSGCYGPFTVPGRAEVILSKKAVLSDGSTVTTVPRNVPFNIEYTIEPLDIPQNSILAAEGTQTIYLKNVRIQDDLTTGFVVTKTAVSGEFIFTGNSSNDNAYTYIIPDIRYNLSTLANGQKVYRAVSSNLKYTVSVKMETSATNVKISEDDLSIMTYTNPLDDAQLTRKFNNSYIGSTFIDINPVYDRDTAVTGKAEPGAKITLKINDIAYPGSVTVDSSGNYSFPITKQSIGARIVVTATDSYNNLATAETVVKDGTTFITLNAVTSGDTSVSGTTEPYNDVAIIIDGVTIKEGKANATGSFTIQIPKQPDGKEITGKATDAYSNVAVHSVIVETPVVVPPGGISANDLVGDKGFILVIQKSSYVQSINFHNDSYAKQRITLSYADAIALFDITSTEGAIVTAKPVNSAISQSYTFVVKKNTANHTITLESVEKIPVVENGYSIQIVVKTGATNLGKYTIHMLDKDGNNGSKLIVNVIKNTKIK